MIPFPYAADDHQRKNALALEKQNAALIIEQDKATGRDLAAMLSSLAGDRDRLRAMAAASRRVSRPDSVNRIARVMEELTTAGSECSLP